MKYFHPRKIYNHIRRGLSVFVVYRLIPDKWYLTWKFKKVFGRPIDWKNPKSFNEKINWLKIYDRNPKYHLLVDKFRVKSIVADIIGAEHIIPTIAGGFTQVSEIDKAQLPDKFVIKCNHDSASVIICKDKAKFDWAYAEYKLKWCMAHDYYHYENKQWAYKGIDRCFFVEQYVEDEKTHNIPDYRFFCFNGKVKCINVDMGRFTDESGVKVNSFDTEWNLIPCQHNHDNYQGVIQRPEALDEMIETAERLAQYVGNPFTRIDLYYINGRIFFGEITFYPVGGMGYIKPFEYDLLFGSWIDLSALKK